MSIEIECLECSRLNNLVDSDYCDTCGRELPIFAEFRSDGFPLCPRCGEDELWSSLMWTDDSNKPTLDQLIKHGLSCYSCLYKIDNGCQHA